MKKLLAKGIKRQSTEQLIADLMIRGVNVELKKGSRSLDATIPITIANCERAGLKDVALKHCDVISINRYFGWYENPAHLDLTCKRLSNVLDEMYDLYGKPIMVTEFGADAIEGFHSTSPQLFTEEYPAELIRRYCEVIESKPFTVGEHVWNFADFRTPQHHRRVVLNCKGVFNRERQPKRAAFLLKRIWGGKDLLNC